MGFTVSQIADSISKNMGDEDSEEIKKNWEDGISKGKTAIFFGMGESERAQRAIEEQTGLPYESVSEVIADVRAQQALTEGVFGGDARAMLDFLVEHGHNPEIADLDFREAVTNGDIARLAETLDVSQPEASDEVLDDEMNDVSAPEENDIDSSDHSDIHPQADDIVAALSEGGAVYAMSSDGHSFISDRVEFSDLNIKNIDANTGADISSVTPDAAAPETNILSASVSSVRI